MVDSYGPAVSAFAANEHGFPAKEEVAAAVAHPALQCPECGVADWRRIDENEGP